MTGDLHTHTDFSDGALCADFLPVLAQRAGLTHLAISDHDSMRSVRYAKAHPEACGVQLIPAAELTGFDTKRGTRVHVLCYFPDESAGLEEFCNEMARRRNEAGKMMLEQIEARFPLFRKEDAAALTGHSGVLFKTHIMRVLYEYGYTDSIYGALYRELKNGKNPVMTDPEYETVETVLDLIREARGVAVLAHPSVYHNMELAAELAAAGRIDGVEIDHPRNLPEDKKDLHELAQQYGLIVTGGTDFHGMHSTRPVPLGSVFTTDENLRRLFEMGACRKG